MVHGSRNAVTPSHAGTLIDLLAPLFPLRLPPGIIPGTIHAMTESEKLPDEELGARAADWRKRALQGDPRARGIAHQLETELRRRSGAPFPDYDTLDLRPLEHRQQSLSKDNRKAVAIFAITATSLLLGIAALFFVSPFGP